MKTLAEINDILGDSAADLTQIIADAKAAVASSYETQIAEINTKATQDVKDLNAAIDVNLATIADLQKKLEAKEAEITNAVTASATLRAGVAQLGNAQRDEINALDGMFADFVQKFDTKLDAIRSINTKALADDDARKLAQEQADKERQRAELQAKLDALKP